MSFEITKAFVDQFSANFLTLAQQEDSRFASCVDVDSGIVGQSKTVERIGATEAQQMFTRHGDTTPSDTPHSRRWIDLIDYNWSEYIDDLDKAKMLADPTSEYLRAGVNAMNRKKDEIIIAALRGNARTADSGNVALPSTQKIAVDATGLTIAKLLSTKRTLDEAEVGSEERYLAVSAEQIADLLGVQQVTSSDYNAVRTLVDGKVDTFLGFKVIQTERLAKVGTSRFCMAWAKSGLRLGVGTNIATRISVRPDKNYSTQVYAQMSLGAVRTEDVRVVEIACLEAA